MEKIFLLFILSGLTFSLWSQPYDQAPKLSKKVMRITEWVSPNLNTKPVKGMVSHFDRHGNLLSYTGRDSSILNTRHVLNSKGQILEKREGEGVNTIVSRFSYNPARTVCDMSFRGKQNRLIYFYDQKRKLVEQKMYSRGLELGKNYQLRERILFQYDKSGKLLSEKCIAYSLNRPREFETRKKIYHYHPEKKYLTKVINYDFDGSPSMMEDYVYYSDGKLKSMFRSYLKNQRLESIEYLYQDGKLWQRITSEMGSRHVEIFTKGRLIRLRSYHGEGLYRVVDYQYEYY